MSTLAEQRRSHLTWLAAANGVPRPRVAEVLAAAGLTEAGDRRVREFSLGMQQRLGMAAALLGNPGVLVLDEPINGLDPEGIISSHLMSEMALTADHLVVIGRGRLLAADSIGEFIERSGQHVYVQTNDVAALTELVRHKGGTVVLDAREGLTIAGIEGRDVGILAAGAGLTIYELSTERARWRTPSLSSPRPASLQPCRC